MEYSPSQGLGSQKVVGVLGQGRIPYPPCSAGCRGGWPGGSRPPTIRRTGPRPGESMPWQGGGGDSLPQSAARDLRPGGQDLGSVGWGLWPGDFEVGQGCLGLGQASGLTNVSVSARIQLCL